ncbi:hypothetical protein PHYBLDRAFT_163551 [Phycomyces blakesleeanus NRRL 1555(-)]|uniref:Uncharacterized protein n=1 Tax=Phycomyces blakesleeanus (strain ATCC 8743b / DSM 1359 / FGSC 10004 / NBRC 33097 / NRRL 1555) TaxID=763407 RepID=A0A163EG34_PHYB8|nr:hypothetical protein PHYBLDRAFT_163551 [Phycomyces blakesleeanus NRRL 1555(-)]OAD78440.1 hypothetical protein PHYBLDRAFT_163551 [Phycomyces blakesleeanus NRRL 1555(-)]|eukprot:XP_018296480.1 hypothetical protein PHYBLDRAFT_163551 [Phycomyces blakesleeanus NRRL 1555(-)]
MTWVVIFWLLLLIIPEKVVTCFLGSFCLKFELAENKAFWDYVLQNKWGMYYAPQLPLVSLHKREPITNFLCNTSTPRRYNNFIGKFLHGQKILVTDQLGITPNVDHLLCSSKIEIVHWINNSTPNWIKVCQ